MLWEIDENYETRDSSIKIEEKSKQAVRYLLLDGQQRLTSLVSMLKGIPTQVRVGSQIRDVPIEVFFNMNHPEETSNFEDYDEDHWSMKMDPRTGRSKMVHNHDM